MTNPYFKPLGREGSEGDQQVPNFKPLGSTEPYLTPVDSKLLDIQNIAAERILGQVIQSEHIKDLDGGPFCFFSSLASVLHAYRGLNYRPADLANFLSAKGVIFDNNGLSAGGLNREVIPQILRNQWGIGLQSLPLAKTIDDIAENMHTLTQHLQYGKPAIILHENTWKAHSGICGGNEKNRYKLTYFAMSPVDNQIVAYPQDYLQQIITDNGVYMPEVILVHP